MSKKMIRLALLALTLSMLASCAAASAIREMPLDTVSLLSALDAHGGESRVTDAVMLEDGSVLLCGTGLHEVSGDTFNWLACIDSQSGDLLWADETAQDDAPAPGLLATALAAADGGYVYCAAGPDGTLIEKRNGAETVGTVLIEGQAADLCLDPDGHYVVVGRKDEKPWAAKIDEAGGILWERLRDTDAEGAGYGRLCVTTDGILAGGREPGYYDLLDHYSWAGTWDISAAHMNAGNNENITGICAGSSSLVIVCGTNEDGAGKPYATSSALSAELGVLAGPQNSHTVSGYNDAMVLLSPKKNNRLDVACGFSQTEDGDVQYSTVALLGHDGYPYDCWYIPFGGTSEAITILQAGQGRMLVVGHGNGTAIGVDSAPEIRPYVIEIRHTPVEDASPNG